MGSKGRRDSAGRKRRGRGGREFLSLVFIAALVAAIGILIARFPPAPEYDSSGRKPYGIPEFVVELPPGYEDLLPGEGRAISPESAPRPSASPASPAPSSGSTAKARQPGPASRPKPASRAGARTLAIVIDDAGNNLRQLDGFLKLPFPLTIAVLPGLRDSGEAARRVLAAGKELILHQPMEALGKQDPGPGAVLLSMKPEEAAATLARNLDGMPGAVGLNNHMGSAVTRDPSLMEALLSLAKGRGIYYLDSLTTADTAVRQAGLGLDMNTWERDVFLDNEGDRESILEALREGRRIAAYKGPAILIGHAWSSELASTLMEFYPQLVAEGYSLSTISRLMILEAGEEGSTTDAAPGN